MALLLKVACPDCGQVLADAPLGAELRCAKCGRDFRAQGDGEGASRIISATPDDLDGIPYSQRSIEVPVNSVSSLIVADPALLYDKLLRDTPLRENTRWVGKVRLLKKLGQGGMGSVYRGYDESLALDVAVKVLPLPSGARDDQFVQRFRQEARISARINHPNVVRTLHVDEQGDLIYLVMDFIEGQTARCLVDTKGPLMLPLALQIIHDATLGMQAAHAHGVIHRDIKPDNILIADDGRVLISDLGLAKAISTGGRSPRMPVTRLGLLLGTPEYMSPEQWDIGADAGPAADIWGMGATLWMLLTRRPPFDEKDMSILARQVKEGPLPDIRLVRPTLPDRVLDILLRCLEKRPEDRFTDSAELLRALDAALEDLAAGRAVVTPRPRPRSPTPVRLPAVAVPPAAPGHPRGGAPTPAPAPREATVTVAPLPPAPPEAKVRRPVLWAAAAAFVLAATGGW
ncbi:MAG: protein kinase, partial [Planctomycetota bacterium]|nr:protein kinase [Planctomycetota bacterium]